MSVVVETEYGGETFDVEIFHDGHIEFPDRDFEYEQGMEEFTNSESAVAQFNRLWKESPMDEVILKCFDLPKNSTALLAADCAEHVLHFYEDKYPDDLRPRNAIDTARKFLAGEIDWQSLEKARKSAWVAWEATTRAADRKSVV